MLENTFIHLPGLGPRNEKKLWDSGIKTWQQFMDEFSTYTERKEHCKIIGSSLYALKQNDADYFGKHLPKRETWRGFPEFQKIAYVDIETTGLGRGSDYITAIGLFDGRKSKSYVCGQNLNEFPEEISKYEAIVTFNGSLFDVPFIKRSFEGVVVPELHIDLRFVLSSLGVRGGLKRIEEQFGFEREDDLKGLTGYDAVKLWRKYMKNNDKDALDKLIRYNIADISNLKKLMEWAYEKKRKETGFDCIN